MLSVRRDSLRQVSAEKLASVWMRASDRAVTTVGVRGFSAGPKGPSGEAPASKGSFGPAMRSGEDQPSAK
jgi:hypothetical protein